MRLFTLLYAGRACQGRSRACQGRSPRSELVLATWMYCHVALCAVQAVNGRPECSPAGPHLRRDSLPVCVGPVALGIGRQRSDACEVAVAEADDADEEKVHHDDQDERHADQRDCTAGSATARPVQSATAVSTPQYR